MDSQLYAVLSTLSGVAVGGAINHFATKKAKDREWQQSIKRERIIERGKLYADFMSASQKLIAQSVDEKFTDLMKFDVLYNEMARIELISSEPVVRCATRIVEHALDRHAQIEIKPTHSYVELKKAFIEAVKAEMGNLEKA